MFAGDFKSLSARDIKSGMKNVPQVSLTEGPLADALVAAKVCASKREAREFIGNGAISINGEVVKDAAWPLTKECALEGGIVTGDSMRARGYGAAKRTSFMIYTMTALDWILLGIMVILAAIVIVFALLGSTAATYTPELSVAEVSGGHLVGLIAYCLFLLIPTVLHIKEAMQWHISRSKI